MKDELENDRRHDLKYAQIYLIEIKGWNTYLSTEVEEGSGFFIMKSNRFDSSEDQILS